MMMMMMTTTTALTIVMITALITTLTVNSIVILSDDHSRVCLKTIDGDPNSDYINACTVNVSMACVFGGEGEGGGGMIDTYLMCYAQSTAKGHIRAKTKGSVFPQVNINNNNNNNNKNYNNNNTLLLLL